MYYKACRFIAGCLENEPMQILVDYLIVGNEEIKLDMLKCLRGARDITFINKVRATQ